MKKLFLILLLAMSSSMAAPPITVVVPFPPGGFVDTFGRNVAKYLNVMSQQDVVVVNKPGADARIGTDYVAQQPVDELHLLVSSTGSMLFNRVLFNRLNYDYNSFDNMVPMVQTPIVFAVSNRLGVKNFADFVKLAQTSKLNCAGSSASTIFVGKYIFKQLGLTEIQFIPFKGSNDMIVQLIAGNIDCAFETNLATRPLYRDQKIQILATGSNQKYANSPNVILFSDIVPGLTFYNWSGISISKNSQSKEKIFEALKKISRDPAYKNSMHDLGLEIVESPTNGNLWLEREYQKYEALRLQLKIDKLD